MSFATKITRLPFALDPARGEKGLACCATLPDPVPGLVRAAAGSSPYLAGLMAKEGEWLATAIPHSPGPADLITALLGDAGGLTPEELGPALRQAKRRVALYTALADLGGVWSLEEVTLALTLLADRACELAFAACLRREADRGKLPAYTGRHGGLFVLAMGKMGAAELNYSSDIDLIVLFDQDAYEDGTRAAARAALIRVTRQAVALLSNPTEHGYVFRVDLRLRPDASMTPVCISTAAALAYYEAEGRSWERAAFIKARPCAGDIRAGEAFLRELSPFIWRRHLDFAAIDDAHSIRLRIRDHKNLKGAILARGHDLKLGKGGIREIEFFAQTQQLIAGGRDPSLRCSGTVAALAALAGTGRITAGLAQELSDHYREYRLIEHRIQMVNDAQTHILPETEAPLAAVAALCAVTDIEAWLQGITARLVRVEALTNAFFAPTEEEALPDLPVDIRDMVDGWRSYPALKSARARQVFRRIEAGFLAAFLAADNPHEALAHFDGFLKGLPAGVQIFSLFEANPHLIDLIVDICTTTPRLALYLSKHSSVLGSVLGGGFFSAWPGAGGLRTLLEEELLKTRQQSLDGYEEGLDAVRRFAHEWQFRVGVHYLRELVSAPEASSQYADIADSVVQVLTALVSENFARRHGGAPGRGAVIVAMGSAGARRMHASSDLDLLCIYDAGQETMSEGPKPLQARTYYARLTQALVTALSVPTAAGRLYEVDMRLRPSGRQGPVATSLNAFRDYQLHEAWVWEHLALTRARPVAATGRDGVTLMADFEALRRHILQENHARQDIMPELARMRDRLSEVANAAEVCRFRSGAGRLQDIELFAQSLALRSASALRRTKTQIGAGQEAGFVTADEAGILVKAQEFFWTVLFAGRLLTDKPISAGSIGQGGQTFLLRQVGLETGIRLEGMVQHHAQHVAGVIDKYVSQSGL